MAYLIIPWQDSPEFAQQVQLEGTTYRLRARWNTLGEAWHVDFLTAQREPIVTGIRIVAGVSLLAQFRDDRLPPGDLFVIGCKCPTRDALGNEAQLVYRESGTDDAV